MSPIGSTPPSNVSASSGLFFPPSQPTPDHMLLAARKQQLAHLQSLQRQQQQMLQQMTPHTNRGSSIPLSGMMAGVDEQRSDRFTSGGVRLSYTASPMNEAVSPKSTPSTAAFSHPISECDYDVNPTELYLAVQKKDWDAASTLAIDFPFQASTWVSRKEADGKLRWRLLPLHAAIIFKAPENAIQALLSAFTQGAALKDDQGMLPIHLAFRNECTEGVVNLLLMAYPQSVDVQDRKGRTPMVLAQQSSSPHREAYIRALERGPAYYAVANAAKDGLSEGGAMITMTEEERNNIDALRLKIDQLTIDHAERVNELEAELSKTQETSQVLVDHVNSLEAQLASRSDTERFLATKIAKLDSQLKIATKQLEDSESNLQTANAELEEKNSALLSRIEEVEAQAEEYKLALEDKREAAKKVYAMTNKERISYEDRMEKCERDAAAHQANAAVLEAQLKKKIETEHALASQVSMLAAQLAASASNTSETTITYQRKCETLTAENKVLKAQVEELENKLSTVATALDAMAAEQDRIVAAATRHEKTMADATSAHLRIVSDTARQESLLEDAAKEREQIVAILMRQAEDAERTMADRERVLEMVKEQEDTMLAAAEERDLVVSSVSKQKEYIDFMLNGELRFLKMTKSEEEQEELNAERVKEMEAKKEEFFANIAQEKEEEDNEERDATNNDDSVQGFDAADNEYNEENENDDIEDEQSATVSLREAELKAQIAIEEAMLAKLKAGEDDEEEEFSSPVEEQVIDETHVEEPPLDVEALETHDGEVNNASDPPTEEEPSTIADTDITCGLNDDMTEGALKTADVNVDSDERDVDSVEFVGDINDSSPTKNQAESEWEKRDSGATP